MKSVIVGTAGHIDHGKSALVCALTGTDPDRLKEEKARGITIDLGFAHLELDGIQLAFVDVPGHERFVKNMLAGAGGVDLVVLVVAADESVMPQTREHFDICRLLRVPAGLVALTKVDLVDPDGIARARLDVRDLVTGSFLEGAPTVPVSTKSGEGLDVLRERLSTLARNVSRRGTLGPARLPVDRVFSMKGFGTVVTGTLVSGSVAIDDELDVSPGDRRVKVRGLQVHGHKHTRASAGQRIAVNLTDVEVHDLGRGQSLVAPESFEQTRVADAVVEVLAGAKPLKHGARVRFHQGTAEILARVAMVGPLDGSRAAPVVMPGSRAFVRLRFEAPATLARGDRYILRAYSPSITIAGGVILNPQPPRMALRSQTALDRSRRLDWHPASGHEGQIGAAVVMIEDAGIQGLPVHALVSRAAIDGSDTARCIERLAVQRQGARAGNVLVGCNILHDLMSRIGETLAAHHKREPLSEGLPREELRQRLFARGHPSIFERALDDLVVGGTVVARDRVALTAHRVALSPEEARARLAIERAFRAGGLTPPDVQTVTAASSAVADRVVKLLQRQKVLVRVGALLFHEEPLERLKAAVEALKSPVDRVQQLDVATFKQRFGVTRKFAIPLLEYLDRERVTRRVGDTRVLL